MKAHRQYVKEQIKRDPRFAKELTRARIEVRKINLSPLLGPGAGDCGVVLLEKSKKKPSPGDLVTVEVTDVEGYDLVGRITPT